MVTRRVKARRPRRGGAARLLKPQRGGTWTHPALPGRKRAHVSRAGVPVSTWLGLRKRPFR